MICINNVLIQQFIVFMNPNLSFFFFCGLYFGNISKDCWPNLVHKVFLHVYFKSFVGLDFKLCLWSILG